MENCPAQALTLADDETLITLAKQRRLRSACQGGAAAVAARYSRSAASPMLARRSGKWR